MLVAWNSPDCLLRGVRLTTALILALALGCDRGETRESAISNWITEREYRFGTTGDNDLVLQRPLVRADPLRNRILVLDPPSSQVSEWTPEGKLGFVVGRRGEGPGEFMLPQTLFIEVDGSFSVLESNGARFTYFTASGDLVESMQGPGTRIGYQGFRISLAWPRHGVHLGIPRLPLDIELGLKGNDPIYSQPLLRVRVSDDGEWLDPEPLLWLNVRNRVHFMPREDGGGSYGAQPFGDADHVRFEPGKAMVVRTRQAPGAVELIEVDGGGDTLWHRRLRFEPTRLTSRIIDDRVNRFLEAMEDYYVSVSRPELRDRYYEGLYKPEYLPATDGPPVLAASGDVWIRTHEVSDTLRTHYVLRRGDSNESPRRVLLPEWLLVSDATATHVWGVWYDSMDVPHIVGRRLIPWDPIE